MAEKLKPTKNFAAERSRLAHWLATPELERTPLTQKALAEELGVHEVTLSNWKTPALMAKVNALVDEHLADEYAMAVDSMKREVRKGSFPHTKLYFEMIGKYTPKEDHSISGEVVVKAVRMPLSELRDDEGNVPGS